MHAGRKAFGTRLDDQVHMGAHEAVREDAPPLPDGHESQQTQEAAPVLVVQEDESALDSASRHMEVSAALERDPASDPWHGETIARQRQRVALVDKTSRFRVKSCMADADGMPRRHVRVGRGRTRDSPAQAPKRRYGFARHMEGTGTRDSPSDSARAEERRGWRRRKGQSLGHRWKRRCGFAMSCEVVEGQSLVQRQHARRARPRALPGVGIRVDTACRT